jgi:Mn-dependent DtxR family transcriptional regulator
VRTIHNSPLFEKPPIGNNPFEPIKKEKMEEDVKLSNALLVKIIEMQGLKSITKSREVQQELGISAALFRMTMTKLISSGFVKYYMGYDYVGATDEGVVYAFENELIR